MRFGAFVFGLVACGGGAAVVSTTDPVAPPPGDDAVGPPRRPEDEHALDAAAPRPVLVPDGLDDVDVTTTIRTDTDRRPISPLLYGMNTAQDGTFPPAVLAGVTFLRRGGDRSNAYDWETNISNGAAKASWANDRYLARNLERPDAPGELDRVLIAADLAAGRGTMIPFVLNDHVAGPVASGIPWDRAGFDIAAYFRRVELVKPAPFATTPDLADGVVYTDENVDFLRRQFPGDIYAAGPTQVMVGSDNEPDLYVSNFPMLQRGTGDALRAPNGVEVGRRLTGAEFTARYLRFATRVKEIAPAAYLVGPDHFHFDGYTNFHTPGAGGYTDDGRWYMDDFLGSVRAASEAAGVRLLHTWDFHWYPQQLFGGTFAWKLDDSVRPMTDAEVDAVVQGPRSYWDPEFDEHSWITDDHLHGPARILARLLPRVEAGYPGTKVGVTEYFPGGCAHVTSALGVVETLGIFARWVFTSLRCGRTRATSGLPSVASVSSATSTAAGSASTPRTWRSSTRRRWNRPFTPRATATRASPCSSSTRPGRRGASACAFTTRLRSRACPSGPSTRRTPSQLASRTIRSSRRTPIPTRRRR